MEWISFRTIFSMGKTIVKIKGILKNSKLIQVKWNEWKCHVGAKSTSITRFLRQHLKQLIDLGQAYYEMVDR